MINIYGDLRNKMSIENHRKWKLKMVPLEVGNKMATMIKNSEKRVINNCGHMIIFEKAFEMRKLVKDFLTK